jgi:hypothetical protein
VAVPDQVISTISHPSDSAIPLLTNFDAKTQKLL